MRIVSLLPAATEWIYAFGAGERLVGRSHACDYPPAVSSLPALTRPSMDVEGQSGAIDAAVKKRLQEGLSLFDVDLSGLRELAPDLVVTQAQCDVCAVAMPQIQAALADWVGGVPELFSLEPYTLRQVLDQALHLGKAVGRMEAAIRYIGDHEVRLRALRDRLGLHKRSDTSGFPTVVCIGWMDPLMIAGHWMPAVAEMAGGRALLAAPGERSRYVAWEDIRAADPDVLAVMPCGFTVDRTRQELSVLTEREGWGGLRAVRDERVVLLDGNAYFNRPGPRIYRSIDLLASVLHPDRVPLANEPWEMHWETG